MDESRSDFEIKLDKLREKYLSRCRERVSKAEDWVAAAATNLDAVQKLHAMAHEMAGSGATYGFPRITRAADQIETWLEPYVRDERAVEEQGGTDELDEMLHHLRDSIPSDL